MVGEFVGEGGGAGLFYFVLRGQHGGGGGFPAFGNDGGPIVDGGKKLFSVEPEIEGREIESGDGVEGDALFVAWGFEIEIGNALYVGFAFGEQRDFSFVG